MFYLKEYESNIFESKIPKISLVLPPFFSGGWGFNMHCKKTDARFM
jgi:hypothetical protein